VNLWTVGCADPRLTAQARSPMDKPGKTPCVSPTLPTGAAAHKLHSTPQQDRMNLISGNDQTSSRLPAFSLFFPGSCPNNRDRRTLCRRCFDFSSALRLLAQIVLLGLIVFVMRLHIGSRRAALSYRYPAGPVFFQCRVFDEGIRKAYRIRSRSPARSLSAAVRG
jgi:hypothetical protein